MGQQSLLYSFVARNTVVLVEYSAFTGNFSTIAVQCLQKLPPGNNKFTYTCDRHTFNYLVEDGFTYMVVADETIGRHIPFAFLELAKDDFKRRYGGNMIDNVAAHSLDQDFRSHLKEHMQYCVDHPEEMNKLEKVKQQVSQVKGIMMDNIDKAFTRGSELNEISVRAEDLRNNADGFRVQARQIRRKMWMQNMKVKLVVLGIVIALILIVWLSICHGFKCH